MNFNSSSFTSVKKSKAKPTNIEIPNRNNKQSDSIYNVCLICFDKAPNAVYMPCGHGGICYECAFDFMKK